MISEIPPLILIIEDELPARQILAAGLCGAGYRVFEAESGCQGLGRFATQEPDAVVIEMRLSDVAGIEIVRQLRERSQVPIVALAAAGEQGDKLAALDAGATAVVSKPFEIRDLVTRLEILLRSRMAIESPAGRARFAVGSLLVDFATERVLIGGRDIPISPTEYRLLTTLVHHAGRVLTYPARSMMANFRAG